MNASARSRHTNRTRAIRALPLLAALSGCGDAIGPAPSPALPLEGRWLLVSLQEAGATEMAAPLTPPLTAEFRSGIFAIEYGCGSCAGSHTVGDTSIDLYAIICADVAVCPAYSDTFVRLVYQSRSWSATATTLDLSSDSGRVRLRR